MKQYLTWDEIFLRAARTADAIHNQFGPGPIALFGVPRGGIPAVLSVQTHLLTLGRSTRIVEKAYEANVIVDDIIDKGETRDRYFKILPGTPFMALVEKGNGDSMEDWFIFPWERMQNEAGPEQNVTRILQYIGEDPNREGLKDTPSRVVRSFEKLYGGYKEDPKAILKTSFAEGACTEMVVLKGIEMYSTCEHHMLPFYGKAHIGYIPAGKVVGISKLARLLEVFARRLQIQERLGQQITQTIQDELQPLGCGCVLEAQHHCMTSRGVEKQDSIMVTSSLRGVFLEKREVRDEFLRLIGK